MAGITAIGVTGTGIITAGVIGTGATGTGVTATITAITKSIGGTIITTRISRRTGAMIIPGTATALACAGGNGPTQRLAVTSAGHVPALSFAASKKPLLPVPALCEMRKL